MKSVQNLLSLGFTQKTSSAIDIFIDKQNIVNHYAIAVDGVLYKKKPRELHNYYDFKNYNLPFSSYSEFPLDCKLVETFSSCEVVTLSMMDRVCIHSMAPMYHQRRSLYLKILKFWYNYLLLNEIDLVVSGTTPHVVFDFILYSVCRYLQIPFRFFHRLPVVVGASTYLYCADSIDPLILTPAGYSSLEKVNRSHINAYLRLGQPRGSSTLTFDGVKKPDYYKYLRLFRVFRSLVIRLKMFNSFLRRPFSVRTTLIRLLDTRSKNFSRWSNMHDIGKFTRFAYFPLHHQPECSTIPMGRFFGNQKAAVEFARKVLPMDIPLIVKPHKRHGDEWFDLQDISQIPGVFVMKPSINSTELLQNSFLVFAITGTSGWESIFMKKPVIMFGSYIYGDAPNVYQSTDFVSTKLFVEEIVRANGLISDFCPRSYVEHVLSKEAVFEGFVDNRYAKFSQISEAQNSLNIASALINSL